MAETLLADTRGQSGNVTKRKREYPLPTALLQTQCGSPKKPPIRPFTTNQGGRPIKDEKCVDLAIALAKLDLTCLEILEFAASCGFMYRPNRDTHSEQKYHEYSVSTTLGYTSSMKTEKELQITDVDIILLSRKLWDINRSVSMVLSQDYLSSTEVSRYWELLPSALVFLASISTRTLDVIVKSYRIPVQAHEVRQMALIVARKGALEHETRTGLRQRWVCMEKVGRDNRNGISEKLRVEMLRLCLFVDLIQDRLLGC